MSKPAATLNWSAYNASLRERGSLTVWFDPAMAWHATPSGKRGRQQTFWDAAIQACLTIKVLFGLPLRQTTGFVVRLMKLAGLDWPVPDYSTLCRQQQTLAVQLPYRGAPGPLHLLIDGTGIKVRGEGEWHGGGWPPDDLRNKARHDAAAAGEPGLFHQEPCQLTVGPYT